MAIHNNIPISRDVYHVSDRSRERRDDLRTDRVEIRGRDRRKPAAETVDISHRCPVCGAPCAIDAAAEEELGEYPGDAIKPKCPAEEAYEVEHQHLESLLGRLRKGAPAGIKSFLLQEARLLARTLRERTE